jgi:hypothetical protein
VLVGSGVSVGNGVYVGGIFVGVGRAVSVGAGDAVEIFGTVGDDVPVGIAAAPPQPASKTANTHNIARRFI